MDEASRFSVETVGDCLGWCVGCGWALGPSSDPAINRRIGQAATTHALTYPDHEVHLTTTERTTMKHIRWQATQPVTA